eukprot:GEMP01120224.1.p2 GENE.GEMP01120224.1~~GEMP01120224.1.p2  ORF type:complete len:116 (-),score=13.39 GEMP01120224.1:142-489(-)
MDESMWAELLENRGDSKRTSSAIETVEPILPLPVTVVVDPRRAWDLEDRGEPKVLKPTADTADSRRARLRSNDKDPTCAQSNISIRESKRVFVVAEMGESRRAWLLDNRDDPKWA